MFFGASSAWHPEETGRIRETDGDRGTGLEPCRVADQSPLHDGDASVNRTDGRMSERWKGPRNSLQHRTAAQNTTFGSALESELAHVDSAGVLLVTLADRPVISFLQMLDCGSSTLMNLQAPLPGSQQVRPPGRCCPREA